MVTSSLVIFVVAGLLLLLHGSAQAVPRAPGPTPRTSGNTDLVMTGTGPGQGVTGSIGPVGSASDPSQNYPSTIPGGFTRLDEGFAGIIRARSVETSETLSMYCIDIRTATYPGIGYENGSWDASNVSNVGSVARTLADYYPNSSLPAAPNDNIRAAAVQAAIWYFSDNYILQPDDPIRPYTETIVNAVVAAGPLPEPSPPNLTINPANGTGAADDLLGPFTVNSDSSDPDLEITVSVTGGGMYADAGGATAIANNSQIARGSQVWLRPTDTTAGGPVVLTARGVATVPSGNVYLYDGNTSGVTDAQRLILAEDAEVSTAVDATADFYQTSSLRVVKTIAGSGAGEQGSVTVRVSCDNGLERDIVIAAGAAAGET
ncbi:MAG: thioester domain-containing protein, partial [Propionibacteriaceae bacterium]